MRSQRNVMQWIQRHLRNMRTCLLLLKRMKLWCIPYKYYFVTANQTVLRKEIANAIQKKKWHKLWIAVNFYAGGATTTLSIFFTLAFIYYFVVYFFIHSLFNFSCFGVYNIFFVLRSSSKLCAFTCNERRTKKNNETLYIY